MIKVLLLAISLVLSTVEGHFSAKNFLGNSPPSKWGMAFATRNNTMVMFGGKDEYYTQDLFQLTQTPDNFTWEFLDQNNPPPGTLYAKAVVTNTNTMYLLGGMTNATENQNLNLQSYQYSFDSKNWTASPDNTAHVSDTSMDIPRNRLNHSVTYDNNNKIYIYAGALNDTTVYSDFYSLDTITQRYTPLSTPDNKRRFGHTASLLR